jgi:triphosphoribosyl-dephospho-CoA synthetase
MLAAAGRAAVDRRTLAGIITLAIGLAAAKGLSSDRGTPALDWYRARGRDKSRSSA